MSVKTAGLHLVVDDDQLPETGTTWDAAPDRPAIPLEHPSFGTAATPDDAA